MLCNNGGVKLLNLILAVYRVRPAMVSIKWRITTNSIIGIEFTLRPDLNHEISYFSLAAIVGDN